MRFVGLNFWIYLILFNSCSINESIDKVSEQSDIRQIPFNKVKIDDQFWLPKLEVYKNNTIPHGWEYMEPILDEAHAIRDHQKDLSMGSKRWYEANLYKHLEAVFYSLHQFPDQKEAARVNDVIGLLEQVQKENGYLYLFGQNRDLPEWSNVINQDESLAAGHMYESASTHYILSGDNSFLNIAKKSAQHAYDHFILKSLEQGFPGHAAMEGALVDLYRVADNENYLELSREFIERRGHSLNGLDCVNGEHLNNLDPRFYPCEYFQDHKPFYEQKKLKGHAVRGVNFLTGIVDVGIETGDQVFVQVGQGLWENLIQRNIFITGGAGPIRRMESFGMDYELPNSGLNESCTSVGIVNLASKMLRLKNDSEYSDILEKELYNTILHGIGLEDRTFFYSNPLLGDEERGNPWSCCPPNIYRTLLGIGKYIYTQTDNDIYTHLYIGSKSDIQFNNASVRLIQKTEYPWKSKVEITVESERTDEFGISFRIPGWCNDYSIKINNDILSNAKLESGYQKITRIWGPSDIVEIEFNMPVVLMESHPNVKSNKGKVAIQRGPIVYALEGIDNNMDNISIPENIDFILHHSPDKLSDAVVISGVRSEKEPLVFIPYFALSNRGKSNSMVWVNAQGKSGTTSSDKLYGQYKVKNHIEISD